MKLTREDMVKYINEVCGLNAKYVAEFMESEMKRYDGYKDWYDEQPYWFKAMKTYEQIEEEQTDAFKKEVAKQNKRLTPYTAKVGDGASIKYYTDWHACTIIKLTKSTVTVRRDKAIRSKDFVPQWIPGGFSAICTNCEDQEWEFEPDPNGEVLTFRWSEKYKTYGQPNDCRLYAGRYEYYDYNF